MIKIGQKVKFDPWRGVHTTLGAHDGEEVEGTVIYVNSGHHWCEVEYKLGNGEFKTSFNFCDIFGDKSHVRLVRS